MKQANFNQEKESLSLIKSINLTRETYLRGIYTLHLTIIKKSTRYCIFIPKLCAQTKYIHYLCGRNGIVAPLCMVLFTIFINWKLGIIL